VRSEFEINKGYSDITLNPIKKEIPYGAIIELKYIPKGKYSERLKNQKIEEAKKQLIQYDPKTVNSLAKVEFVKIVLVYMGWELVYCEVG